jgi:hypothetical protein
MPKNEGNFENTVSQNITELNTDELRLKNRADFVITNGKYRFTFSHIDPSTDEAVYRKIPNEGDPTMVINKDQLPPKYILDQDYIASGKRFDKENFRPWSPKLKCENKYIYVPW